MWEQNYNRLTVQTITKQSFNGIWPANLTAESVLSANPEYLTSVSEGGGDIQAIDKQQAEFFPLEIRCQAALNDYEESFNGIWPANLTAESVLSTLNSRLTRCLAAHSEGGGDIQAIDKQQIDLVQDAKRLLRNRLTVIWPANLTAESVLSANPEFFNPF